MQVGVDVAQEDLVGQGAMGFADLDADFFVVGGAGVAEGVKLAVLAAGIDSVWQTVKQFTIELPADVDPEKVDASYKKGVLKIELKKTKESEIKKIKKDEEGAMLNRLGRI